MVQALTYFSLWLAGMGIFSTISAQDSEKVRIIKETNENKINVFIGQKLFTSFLYPDSLEKPVLYPIYTSHEKMVTRGFPVNPLPYEPTDHPHHLGLWLNFENVNGLDFWNNSYAIAPEKKHLYGWIRTDRIIRTADGTKGVLSYHANWTNQQQDVLLEETTQFEFSGGPNLRTIDRLTILKSDTDVFFKDAKDGMLGLRVAHELEIPSVKNQKFTDDKGNVTMVKVNADSIANGNYLTSEGKQGDDAWSSRARWCMMYGKMGKDSVCIVMIDHPSNPNYPAFWHARGYGLFALNPLGEKIFTDGKSEINLHLKKGESVGFYYRVVIHDGNNALTIEQLDKIADEFGKMNPAGAIQ